MMKIGLGAIQRPVLTKHVLKKFGRFITSVSANESNYGKIYMTSLMVLRHFCGDLWVERTIYSGKFNFLSSSVDDITEETRCVLEMERVIELAEMLFNLQHVPGFPAFLKRLCQNDVEAVFSELEAAKILRHYGIRFQFNAPIGKARKDFDLSIYKNGVRIAADVKCRLEISDVSEKALINRLKKTSNRQLPIGKPGVIFLRLPEKWSSLDNSSQIIHNSIQKFLSSSTRVVSVIVIRTKFSLEGGFVFNFPGTNEITNPRQLFGRGLVPLIQGHVAFPMNWMRFSISLGFAEKPWHVMVEAVKRKIASC